jgi:hypothetical protein
MKVHSNWSLLVNLGNKDTHNIIHILNIIDRSCVLCVPVCLVWGDGDDGIGTSEYFSIFQEFQEFQ